MQCFRAELSSPRLWRLRLRSRSIPDRGQDTAKLAVLPSWRDYGRFVDTIRQMRSNTNASDPNSWFYWANIHQNFCPRRRLFLAWHRAIFTCSSKRSLRPVRDRRFPPTLLGLLYVPNLPRGVHSRGLGQSALEFGSRRDGVRRADPTDLSAPTTSISRAAQPPSSRRSVPPAQSCAQSDRRDHGRPAVAQDPIFWVHRPCLDRLWTAWSLAGSGGTYTSGERPYWSGVFNYAPGVSLQKVLMRDMSRVRRCL